MIPLSPRLFVVWVLTMMAVMVVCCVAGLAFHSRTLGDLAPVAAIFAALLFKEKRG
jgi:hypothetical protein